MFLDRLRTAQPNSAYVMESFDVTALYTNVSNDSAMQAIFELLTQHEGEINIWSGKYYAQIRGLAMGQRLAPSLAIALMSKVEAPVTELGPLLYCSSGSDDFVEGILCVIVIGEAFLAQKIVKLLEDVIADRREI
ncbi:unnamed protein product [Angiostrongylus costaricensis]|uniref:Reverse transcriptase domain-containing protein n=1 Tax=Angiostrongylus costaricensis TaxID=334426 RepID=A0A0R3Q257_ANGCS|nr:unnamed protein product [Angiostrongylus costaricensis]